MCWDGIKLACILLGETITWGKIKREPGKAGRAIKPWCKSDSMSRGKEGRLIEGTLDCLLQSLEGPQGVGGPCVCLSDLKQSFTGSSPGEASPPANAAMMDFKAPHLEPSVGGVLWSWSLWGVFQRLPQCTFLKLENVPPLNTCFVPDNGYILASRRAARGKWEETLCSAMQRHLPEQPPSMDGHFTGFSTRKQQGDSAQVHRPQSPLVLSGPVLHCIWVKTTDGGGYLQLPSLRTWQALALSPPQRRSHLPLTRHLQVFSLLFTCQACDRPGWTLTPLCSENENSHLSFWFCPMAFLVSPGLSSA